MSQEVHIVAILSPKPGKSDLLKERMSEMCKVVHEKEQDTYRYLLTEELSGDAPKIIMIETYKDKAYADAHTQTEHFKALVEDFGKQDLLSEPPQLMQTSSKLGFERDRKLL